MKKTIFVAMIVVVLTAGLCGCNKRTLGAMGGAAVGGTVGGLAGGTTGAVIGGVAGAAVGSEVTRDH